jgi:hypothetical protein
MHIIRNNPYLLLYYFEQVFIDFGIVNVRDLSGMADNLIQGNLEHILKELGVTRHSKWCIEPSHNFAVLQP